MYHKCKQSFTNFFHIFFGHWILKFWKIASKVEFFLMKTSWKKFVKLCLHLYSRTFFVSLFQLFVYICQLISAICWHLSAVCLLFWSADFQLFVYFFSWNLFYFADFEKCSSLWIHMPWQNQGQRQRWNDNLFLDGPKGQRDHESGRFVASTILR